MLKNVGNPPTPSAVERVRTNSKLISKHSGDPREPDPGARGSLNVVTPLGTLGPKERKHTRNHGNHENGSISAPKARQKLSMSEIPTV